MLFAVKITFFLISQSYLDEGVYLTQPYSQSLAKCVSCVNHNDFCFVFLTSRLLYSLLKFKTSVASSRAFPEYLVSMIPQQKRDLSAENVRLECWEMVLTAPTLMR